MMKQALMLLFILSMAPVYAGGLLAKAAPQIVEVKIPDGLKNETSTSSSKGLQLGQAIEPTIQSSRVLPAGTPIQVVLDQNIDADHIKVGQTVDAHIMVPVKQEGQVVFPMGTPIKGVVTQLKNNSIAGVPGSIELSKFKILMPNGGLIPLTGSFQKTGDSRVAGAVAGGYFLLLPIFIKGQDARLQKGAESTMFTLQEWEYTPN